VLASTEDIPPSRVESNGALVVVIASSLSILSSLLSPPMALFLGIASVAAAARWTPRLLPLAIVCYAHAGALIVASHDFETLQSDFRTYNLVRRFLCTADEPAPGLLFFGPEVGIPLAYYAASFLGACSLSINGLAYVQTLAVSSLILITLSRYVVVSTDEDDRWLAVTGLCLMYSFFYTSQLSRQAVSSFFVLHALFMAKSRKRAFADLALAALFHLTGPIIYLLARVFRRGLSPLVALLFVGLAALVLNAGPLLERVDSVLGIPLIGKFAFYGTDEAAGMALSDWKVILYLLTAGIFLLRVERRDAQVLLGFAVLGLVMIRFPLAATRLSLPFSSLAVGYFLFRGIARASRPLSLAVFAALLIYRMIAVNTRTTDEGSLWDIYPSAHSTPGYYLQEF